ncbi:hypothetical protein LTS18_001636, partial [Coniosporium uncinatum]
MVGTAKPQAGLLIELKDATSRSNELFDSIWAAVERANGLSLQKSRLQREYVTFAEPDKPFIRTDKGTIKRRATLTLYADYIDRFYSTRNEDIDRELEVFDVDISSIDTITNSVRLIFTSILPELEDAPADADVFELGLDSLLVFRAVKIIRTATGLKDQVAPRHLYANPTLATFAAALAKIVAPAQKTKLRAQNGAQNGTTNGIASTVTNGATRDDSHETQKMIAERKRRLGAKMSPFDAVNPNHYMGLNFFFALRPDVSFKEAFSKLQAGLR